MTIFCFCNSGKEKCHYDIDVAWTSEVSNSVIASPALVADIDADERPDIITAAFTEEVAVLHGNDGQALSGSWPANLQDNSFHASPLLVCYEINTAQKETTPLKVDHVAFKWYIIQ